MARLIDIRLKPGERGLLVGQSGSGKTYAAAWLLRHDSQRCVILDTKTEPVFEHIAAKREDYEETTKIVETRAELTRELRDRKKGADYIIVRPSVSVLADPFELDAWLLEIYNENKSITVFIDEAYQLHKGSQAGPGLIALLTRGRARGITTLVGTQRPAWLTRFALTESNRFYMFRLVDVKDWARLSDVIPGIPKDGIPLKRYEYLYYKMGDDSYTHMAPLPPVADLSWTPQAETEPDEPRRKWF